MSFATAPPIPHAAVISAIKALDAAHVDWCILRGEAELDAPVGDVDLLVSARDMGRVTHALAASGYVLLPAWGHGSHRFFVTYDQDSDTWIKLDLVTELAFGPWQSLRTRAAAACLVRRRRTGPVDVLDSDDAFWSLLLHCLLDRGTVPPRHARRLVELASAATGDSPMALEVLPCFPAGWDPARVVEHVRREDWVTLAGLGRALHARWLRRRPVTTWTRRVSQHVLRRLSPLATVAGRGRGRSVALLGLDGAGKSTLAATLVDTFHIPARSLYVPTTSRSVLRSLVPVPGLGLAERLVRLWAKSLVMIWHKTRGRLVVLDRYVYDALLPPPPGYGRRARVNHWVLRRAVPAADVVVLLDLPAEVAHRRKGEHTIAWLTERRRHYLELSHRVAGLHAVDASRQPDQVRRDVTAIVWRSWAAAGSGAAPQR
jgi:thymidylate kinase